MSGYCLPIDASGGAPSFPAQKHRAAQGAFALGRTDRPLGAVSGVRPGSEPTITATATTWTVTPFCAVADPGTALSVGPFLVAFDANSTGAMNAADANNARVDRLDVQVPDDPAGAFGTAPLIVYTVGVAGSNPAAPAAPARSFPLAQITVPKSGSGNPSVSVSTMAKTVASGGVLPCASSTAYPAHPYVGQMVYDVALDQLFRWNGTKWAAPNGNTGWVNVAATPLNNNTSLSVQALRIGPTVSLYASMNSAAAFIAGNAGNTGMFKITDSKFIPSDMPAGVVQSLNPALMGAVCWVIDNTGTVSLVSTIAAVAAGASVDCAGSYQIGA